MAETEITLRNEVEMKIQAQIRAGRTLFSTCLAGPGEIRVLLTEPMPYDIFLKNRATGWEIARKMGSEAKTVTLRQHNGRFLITGG